MTLLTPAVNLNILDINHWSTGWFGWLQFYGAGDCARLVQNGAKAFYEISHHWLDARGEAALRALLINDFEVVIHLGSKRELELKSANDFKDELRRLMKR